jgi:hypothetical protein
MRRRITIDAPILARRINSSTLSNTFLSPASLVTLTAAVARAASAPLYVTRSPSAISAVSHSPGASLVRLLDAFGEATKGRGLGPLAVARLFSDAAGVVVDVRGPEALRVFFSAAAAFERTFATLRAELINEQLCDESNTPSVTFENNNTNNINFSNSPAHSVGTHLSRLTVAYAAFLAHASPVVGAAQVEAAADPLIESLFSAGIWPQREVIFALLDVSVACHRPAAAVRLARAIPILYSVQQQTGAASSIKPMEALVDSIIYAQSIAPISLEGATERAARAVLTFGWSRADVFEVGATHAPLMSAARALGAEPCDAHDALSIIVSFISEFAANRGGDVSFSTSTTYSSPESSTDLHTHAHSELVENCLTLALRLITTYSDVDINGELAFSTLQARLKLAALRNWYSQRPAALDASLGRSTRADIARVFAALANEQLKNTNILSARKLQRQVTGISYWRSGAIGASAAVNTAADTFLLESCSRCEDTVTPDVSLTNITTTKTPTSSMADVTARAASVISSLKILGVLPSLEVGTRVMRIALARSEPALLKNLLSAMGGNNTNGTENVFSLSEASAARIIAMLDAALVSSLDKARAALTLVSMLDDLTAVGAIPSAAFLARILSLASPVSPLINTRVSLPITCVASTKQSAIPLPLPFPPSLISLPIPLPSTDSISSLLSEVSMRLAGVLPSSVMSIPSWRGIPLVLPRAYGGGLSGVILNFPSVLLEVPISLAQLLSLSATGAEAATANTALGNAVNQTLERMPWSSALDLMSNTVHENTLRTLSRGLEPQDSLLLGLRMHANHGSIVRVHAPIGDANVTTVAVAPDHVLMALHLTVPTDLPARPGTRLVPGDLNFNAILVSAAAVLLHSQKLSFRKPRQRGTPRLDEWWHCRIRPLPVGGEEPTPGVHTLPPDWKVDLSPVQRETVIADLRKRYNADLELKMKSKINPA